MSRYTLKLYVRPLEILMHMHNFNCSASAKRRFWSARILFPTNEILESWQAIPRKGRRRKLTN